MAHQMDEHIRIHLLDNSYFSVPVSEVTTCSDVIDWVCENLEIQNLDWAKFFFALFKAGKEIGDELPLDADVKDCYDHASKLVFVQKIFTMASSSCLDPMLIHLRYVQAVHHVMTSVYPCSLEMLIKLSALRLHVTFGNDSTIHQRGFLSQRLLEIIPFANLGDQSPLQWEVQLLREHFNYNGTNPKLEYLELVSELPVYGMRYFKVQTPSEFQQFGARPLDATSCLGVSCDGVSLLRMPQLDVMKTIPFSQVLKWGFVPGKSFWVEVNEKGPVRFDYETPQGHVIGQLISDYIAQQLRDQGVRFHYQVVSSGSFNLGQVESKANDPRNLPDEYESQVKAAEQIQALYRGYLLRRNLEYEYGAMRIQSIWRGYTARCKFDEQLQLMEQQLAEMATTHKLPGMEDTPPPPSSPPPPPPPPPSEDLAAELQRSTPHSDTDTANTDGVSDEKVDAITVIQSNYRGYCVRRDLLEMEEELAAINIQATFRGYKTRATDNQ